MFFCPITRPAIVLCIYRMFLSEHKIKLCERKEDGKRKKRNKRKLSDGEWKVRNK